MSTLFDTRLSWGKKIPRSDNSLLLLLGQFFLKVELGRLRVNLDGTPELQTGDAERFLNIALEFDANEHDVN